MSETSGYHQSATDFKAIDDAFTTMATEVRALNIHMGWRDDDTRMAEYIALLHSEVSEMLEAWRDDNSVELAREFADVLIRLVDMADVYGINLALAYRAKMDKNWQRPYQHGGRTLHHEREP